MFVEDNCFLNTSGMLRGAHGRSSAPGSCFVTIIVYDMGTAPMARKWGDSEGSRESKFTETIFTGPSRSLA